MNSSDPDSPDTGTAAERPSSAKQLYKAMQRQSAGLSARERRVYMQSVHNAILSQFLDGIAYVKGGAAIQLRYPLRDGRMSEDLDAAYSGSLREFETMLADRLTAGWNGFTGSVERLPRPW